MKDKKNSKNKNDFNEILVKMVKVFFKQILWPSALIFFVINVAIWSHKIKLWQNNPIVWALDNSIREYANKSLFDIEIRNEDYRRVVFLSWYCDYYNFNNEMTASDKVNWKQKSFEKRIEDFYYLQKKYYEKERKIPILMTKLQKEKDEANLGDDSK
jgi:hypothetical protein